MSTVKTEKVKKDWHFADKEDEAMGVMTCIYENGGISKKVSLSDGREAVCRRLKGDSRHLIKRITGGSQDKVQDAIVAISTKIDGKDIVIEDIDGMWFNDATALQYMATSLNFI